MLHVKHRHVLMDREIKPSSGRCVQQGLELGDIEIIGSRDAFQSKVIDKIISRQGISYIERKISPEALAGK